MRQSHKYRFGDRGPCAVCSIDYFYLYLSIVYNPKVLMCTYTSLCPVLFAWPPVLR